MLPPYFSFQYRKIIIYYSLTNKFYVADESMRVLNCFEQCISKRELSENEGGTIFLKA